MMNSNLSAIGLSPDTINKIHRVFSRYPDIEWVSLYGSRAKGNFQHGSDIDLSIMGDKVTPSQLYKIESELDDLLLPYQIDLSLFKLIEHEGLVQHIKRVGINFYQRSCQSTDKSQAV